MAGREWVLVEDLWPCPGRLDGGSGLTSNGTITMVLLWPQSIATRAAPEVYAPTAVARHAVRGGDADRQPRRHYAPGHQSAAPSGPHCRRGYAAHEPAAQSSGHHHPGREPA